MALQTSANTVDERAVPEIMPYSGDPRAPVVVICDSPSMENWRARIPMGGRAFSVFSEEAIANRFGREDFLFISPCAPIPEIEAASEKRQKLFVDRYREALQHTIANVAQAPRLFVFLGPVAGYALTGKPVKITKQRGVVRRADNLSLPVLPLFSPMHVLKRPEVKELFKADMRMLGLVADGDYQIDAAALAVGETQYEWRDDISDILDNRPQSMSIDTEGLGVKWYKPETKVLCAQFSVRPGHAIVVPMARWPQSAFPDITSRRLASVRSQFRLLAEDPNIRKAGHNIKFDHHMLRREGIEVAGWTVDTQLLAFFADENMTEKSQDECVRRWVPEMSGYADAFNQDPVHVGKSRMDLVPPDKMLGYGGGDADANFRLAKNLVAIVGQDKRQWNCYKHIQFPAMRAFMDVVEPAGINIDTNELGALHTALTEKAETGYAELITEVPAAIKRKYLGQMTAKQAPEDVLSFSKPSFLLDVLFSKEGFNLKPLVFTKTTAKLPPEQRVPSVSTKDHLPYHDDIPFVVKLMEYQKIAKLQNTYVGVAGHVEFGSNRWVEPTGFWKYLDAYGLIHPSFLLHRTVTGRSASVDPNGQNFPKHGELAKAYRKIFKARPGYVLIECDLSQAELRIAAWMSGDPEMLRIYASGGDIHMATAIIASGLSEEAFFKLPEKERKEFRQKAKAINFGFLYGMSWRKFITYARTTYKVMFSDKEAEAVRNRFFRKYRRLKPWHDAMRNFVRRHGYVRSLHGALRHLPNINSIEEAIRSSCERQAINSPVQRFGSDLGLCAMGRMCRDVDPDLMRPIAFIHDALVIEVKQEYLQEGMKAARFYMESNPLKNWFGVESPIPIIADVSFGHNLAEMEETKGSVPAEAPDWWDWEADGWEERPKHFAYQYEGDVA